MMASSKAWLASHDRRRGGEEEEPKGELIAGINSLLACFMPAICQKMALGKKRERRKMDRKNRLYCVCPTKKPWSHLSLDITWYLRISAAPSRSGLVHCLYLYCRDSSLSFSFVIRLKNMR